MKTKLATVRCSRPVMAPLHVKPPRRLSSRAKALLLPIFVILSVWPVAAEADVSINEWLANPEPQQADFVELFNDGGTPFNLSGYSLTDDLGTPDKFRIAAGTVIQPRGFVVFDETRLGFDLSAAGGTLSLFTSTGTLVQSISFGPQPIGVSEGRWPDGGPNRYAMTPTPAVQNRPPATNEMGETSGSGIFIGPNSVWKYLDNGSDQGTAWRAPAFDDSAWASGQGQLGYGDGDEATTVSYGPDVANKYVTTYFRRAFDVTNSSAISNLNLRVLHDDGVVVYLNGSEVYRNNLPQGEITFSTLALGNPQDENAYVEAAIPVSALVDGRNFIAAEVHQVNVLSSDLGFDLTLLANSTPPPPEVPVVTVTAVDNEAAEQSQSTGLFRVARTGPTDSALRVNLFYDGTAMNGTDFTMLPVVVDFAAGASSVDLTVEPIDDNALEGTETVVLYAVPQPCTPATPCSYRVGEPSQATVRILDNDTNPEPPGTILIASNSVWKHLDKGSDQGTAWRTPAFDDSAWASGPGQLGYGDGDEATIVSFGPDAGNKYITTYFRHSFEVPNAATVSNLVLRVLRDDGVAVYLNGAEVFRSNLPEGEIAFNTLASTIAGDENAYVEAAIPTSALVNGRNVVAAEVHQIHPFSSDMGFDLALFSSGSPPPPDLPVVSVQAVDDVAGENNGNSGTFRVIRSGPTTEPLTVMMAYGGTAANGVDYATLPIVVEIPAGESSTTLTVEPINDSLIEGTETLTAGPARPPCANQNPPGPGCYRVGFPVQITVQILDDDVEPPDPAFSALIASNSVWKYLDNGSDQGSAWRSPGFDDSSWASGPGQLGYGDGDEATVVSFGPSQANKFITTYFRRSFDVTDAALVTNAVLRVLRDDGVVVYLNGVEVFRNNLPQGEMPYNTLALTIAGDENAYVEASIPASALVNGRNVIAAEVHQVNPNSSDMGFDLALLAGIRSNDGDGDGVPDNRDQCLDTPPGAAVDENGCSLAQAMACGSPGHTYADHVNGTISGAWRLYRSGVITAEERRRAIDEAVVSTCGRATAGTESLRVHLLPLTTTECHRDGTRFIVSGDAVGGLVVESSSDLIRWTPLQTLDATDVGNEVACPHSNSEVARFFRVRTAAP